MAHKTTNNIFIKCCLFSRYNYAELLQRPNMLVILQATGVLAITRPILGLTLMGAVNSVQIRSRRICPRSPQSLTYVSSWGFAASPRDSAFRTLPYGASASAVQNAHAFCPVTRII